MDLQQRKQELQDKITNALNAIGKLQFQIEELQHVTLKKFMNKKADEGDELMEDDYPHYRYEILALVEDALQEERKRLIGYLGSQVLYATEWGFTDIQLSMDSTYAIPISKEDKQKALVELLGEPFTPEEVKDTLRALRGSLSVEDIL